MEKKGLSEKDKIILYYIGCLVLLLGTFLLIWLKTDRLFFNTDTTYHLNVAQAFIRAKGIVTWDFWESLPIGRPNNYPPLFPIFIAFLLQIGCSIDLTVKIITEVVVVGGLSLFAFFIYRLINIKVAFWTLFLLLLSRNFFVMTAIVMPASLVVFAAPALLYFVLKQKWIATFALLVLMFYTHLFMPYLIIFSILIYLFIAERRLIIPFIKASACAFVVYLPWLIHVFSSGLAYIKYFDGNFQNIDAGEPIGVNLIVALLLIFGFFIAIKNKKNLSKTPTTFFVIFFLCLLTVIYISSRRATDGHPLALAAVLSATALTTLLEHKVLRFVIIPILLMYMWVTPSISFAGRSVNFLADSSNLRLVLENELPNMTLADEYSEYINYIKNNSLEGESLAVAVGNFNKAGATNNQLYPAIFFGANSSRPTVLLRKPEFFYRPTPDILKTKFLLLNVPPTEAKPEYFSKVGYSDSNFAENFARNFELVNFDASAMKGLYLYKNKNDQVIRETIPAHKMPLTVAYLLIGSVVLVFLYGAKVSGKVNA